MRVGLLEQRLRVFGERVWRKAPGGLVKTVPVPFERMPITWERAFGGTEVDPADPNAVPTMEPHNPLGRGFATRAALLVDKPLPNVEDPRHLIERRSDRPAPVGLGAIAGHCLPRSELAGTYDEQWRRTRMPLWPNDYDPRFHQSAPAGLVAAEPLQGGEPVSTVGLAPEGRLVFVLPREYLVIETSLAGDWTRQRARLERVIVEPDERKLVLVWAARLNCGARGREVEKSRVSTKAWVQR